VPEWPDIAYPFYDLYQGITTINGQLQFADHNTIVKPQGKGK
jgi:hypothetical protein